MAGNILVYHLHSDYSNATTTMDCVTKIHHYIDKAKEEGMKSLCFSEHGNILSWKKKKELIEKAGMKYIHGVEAYVTKSLDEKVRDNYHTILIARNYEGVKEINYLMSDKVANNREDGHFYYTPRITYEELKNTSNNVIITSGCLGGILNSDDIELKKDFTMFMTENKDRCFLEIQHHDVKDQINYNNLLIKIHKNTGIRLIAGTDTHSLNEEYARGRVILQKSKFIHFDNEEGWDLTFKNRHELIASYERQGSVDRGYYMDAIDNTVVLSDMVEEFELDKSYKYPKLYNNSEEVFKKKIVEGIHERGIELDEVKRERIQHELKTMQNNGSIDYMLLEEDYKSWCRANDIPYGFSRGSVSGSYIAYLLKITEMDSIKHNLNFERFMSPERISLCDIDSDFDPSDRDMVKDYIYNKEGLYCADIITFNTIALKGAIRDVGRAMDIPLDVVSEISKNIEFQEEQFREKYPELFEMVDLLNGVIVSVGTHPAGLVVSPYPLEDLLGTCTLKTNKYPVTQIDMKEIDSLNFVKLDLLSLDNIGIIDQTCKLAGIPAITPDNIDATDERVWNSMLKSTLGIFQWESSSASSYYRELFSKETINRIKQNNDNFSYMDVFSMGNGAIRPAGNSYRNALSRGDFKDNGHEVLNEFLKPTLGFLVYQEQIMEFLHRFCGFTMGEADVVRRGFSKKTGTEQFTPRIIEGFVKTMDEDYGVCKLEAEELIIDFISVIEDASDYLFSVNHSQSYSYIGYVCAWLRYYYPLEFLTSLLNINRDNQDKTALAFNYIQEFTEIGVVPIKFRHSQSGYSANKEQNLIYKGIESIKYMNNNISCELYELRENKYNSFTDLLIDIVESTSCTSRQIKILIELNFFIEFGGIKKLLNVYDEFQNGKSKYKKTYVEKTKEKRKVELNEFELSLQNLDNTIIEKVKSELEYLGYAVSTSKEIDNDIVIVSKLEQNKWGTVFVDLYRLNSGEIDSLKIKKASFNTTPLKEMDVIKTITIKRTPKKRKVDGQWTELEEMESILEKFAKVII